MFRKELKWLKKNWPYLAVAIAIFTALVFFSKQIYIYFAIEGVRTVTGVMATVLGIFTGLLGFSIASITQTAISERQYQEALLRDESSWFKDWLIIIPDNIKRKRDVADLPDIIRQHSVFPSQPSEELVNLLRDKFKVFERIFKTWARKTSAQKEIEKARSEFDTHYFSIAAIVIKISHSELRLEFARTLTGFLWQLVFILLLYIGILILSYTTLAQKFAEDWGMLVILLVVASFIFIFGIIRGVAGYSQIESRMSTFTLAEK
jgi:hypothetical protein